MTHLPSPTSNKNPGLQAAALQKRLFTRSDKNKVQDIYFLLYDTVQLQSFIRLLLVSYLSYHCLRNQQNFGIIKMSPTLALLTHLTYPPSFLYQLYPEINPLAIFSQEYYYWTGFDTFTEKSPWPSWTCSRLGVLATYTLRLPLPQKQEGCSFASNICRLNKLSLRAISTICSFVKLISLGHF